MRKYSAALSEYEARTGPAQDSSRAPPSTPGRRVFDRRAVAAATSANNIGVDNRRLDLAQKDREAAAAEKVRNNAEDEAASGAAVKFIRNPDYLPTADEETAIARSPHTTGLLTNIAQRRAERQAREAAAKEKTDRAASDETATVLSAHGQIQGVAKRAADEGLDVTIPKYAFAGPTRTPGKEMVRLAGVVEKNYDDAFHAKQAEMTRSISSDKTADADRRRAAQHQVDSIERQLAAKKKVADDLEKRITAAESFAPGSTKDGALDKAHSAAIDAYNRTVKARNSAYKVIGRLVGFENIVDPETGMPMADASDAPAAASAKPWANDPLYKNLSPADKARWDAEQNAGK